VEDAIIHVDIPGHVGLLKVSVMPKLVSDLIIGNDWQTAIRQPVTSDEAEDSDEFTGEINQLFIVNSTNQHPIENNAVSQSTEVPSDENEDETMVKQMAAEMNVEVESEEGDPPAEITSAVRNTIIIDNIEYQEVMPEFSVAVQTRESTSTERDSVNKTVENDNGR
jgi:hypothetical protein